MLRKLEEVFSGFNRGKIILIIAILILICYVNSLGVFFIWDDYALILDNLEVKQFDIGSVLGSIRFQESGSLSNLPVYFRPLQAITYMFDYAIWHNNAFGYHLSNIFLHFANTVLLFILLSILSKNKIIPFLGSALFAANPLFTLSVTYISGRSDLLVLFFTLLSLILFLKSWAKGKFILGFYCLAMVSFALALLSKEIGLFILPVYFFINKTGKNEQRFRKLAIYLPFLLLSVIYLLCRPHFAFKGWEYTGLESKNNLFYLLTFIKGNVVYLWKAIFPGKVYMQYAIQTVNSFSQIWFYSSIFVILGLGVLISLKKRLQRGIFLGCAWFFLPLSALIFMNIVFARIGTELLLPLHNLYFSYPGIILLADGIFNKLDINKKRIFIFCASLGVIYYALSTIQENNYWQEEVPFYQRIINYNKNSAFNYIPLSNLGYSYERQKKYDLAEKYLEEALKLSNRNVLFYNGFASFLIRRGNFDKAVKILEESLTIDSNFSETYSLLGIAKIKLGNIDEAKANFEKASSLGHNTN